MKRRTADPADGASASAHPDVPPARRGDPHPAPRSFERRLGRRDLSAVARTRAELRSLLAHWGAPGRAETAELLTSELVTNALVHTDGSAVVRAALTGSGELLRVEVRDFAARHPSLRVNDDIQQAATSGRGLLLVHSLADGWGVRPHGVGKTVWFELRAQEP